MTKILIDETVVRQGDDAIVSYFAAANRDEEMEAEDALLEFRSALRQALADAALDKMAEDARELGLSYEQPATAQLPPNCGTNYCSCIECLFEKSGIGITKGGE